MSESLFRRALAPTFIGGMLLCGTWMAAPAYASKAGGEHAGGEAPPGNNGTIKINEFPADEGQANDPHVDCDFSVKFFGYDAGTQTARMIFTGHAPTRGGVLLDTTTTWTSATRGGGNQLDKVFGPVNLTKAFADAGMTPHNKQGYHVKLTVEVTGAKGADTKHKVFWVTPCATTKSATVADNPVVRSTVAPTTTSTTPATTTSTTPATTTPTTSTTAVTVATPAGSSARPAGLAVPSEVLGTSVDAPSAETAPSTKVLAATATRPSALAFTGATVGRLLAAAGLLLVSGCAIVLAARRRQAGHL